MPKERVAITKVQEQRLDEALEHGLELIGGLERIAPAGSRVLIKPNYTIVPTDRGITHPEVVEAVTRAVAARSPAQIVIAESSGDYYTSYCYRLEGLYRIAARYGARLVDLNVEEGVRVPVPADLGRDHVMVPRVVADSEVIISLPVFKLWGGSPMSLCLKNFFGLYGARYYGHNKHSREIVREHPFFALPGEVGEEPGIHSPSVAQSVCAINCAVPTHLGIIDALEGGDGGGNWIRLDTLIVGTNPVAIDTVGMALAGYDARNYPTFTLCHEHGLGPCNLEDIEVVGSPLEECAFRLERLRDNVLEMPLDYCLNLLSTGELQQMVRGMQLHGLLPQSPPPSERGDLLALLKERIAAPDYYREALAQLGEHPRKLLELIIERGGTSGDLVAIRNALSEYFGGGESLHYAPAARTLLRLGLAYPVDGAWRHYYLLPEGLLSVYRAG
ncbi:MAG: DUF362 domain-containing protein [Chloroflexi bacterium]|nr:DUF362 domain-containing protein [Chloroflexota bacterium]